MEILLFSNGPRSVINSITLRARQWNAVSGMKDTKSCFVNSHLRVKLSRIATPFNAIN